jgi:CheY-like chemotaxis protein
MLSKVENRDADQETVLVVEDEVLVRSTIAEYLRSCGYRVIEAVNADEALIVIRNLEIKVDIVFSDVEMPGTMDGFALASWIRKNRPELDVILAGSVTRAADSAEKLCDDGPLPKPYQAETVVRQIRRLLAARLSRQKK